MAKQILLLNDGPSRLINFAKRTEYSRAMFYKLLKAGQAPRCLKVGTKVLISTEAAAAWLREREATSMSIKP